MILKMVEAKKTGRIGQVYCHGLSDGALHG